MMWSLSLLNQILPRHVEILQLVDHFFLEKIRQHESVRSDPAKISRLQLIMTTENGEQMVRITHVCFVSMK